MILSIVIPAYNAEKYIGTALESLINQTCQDFEVIIVDDGSDDETSAVAEKFLSESWINAFKIIRTGNGGVSSARNSGLSAASGNYVVFLDADDYVSRYLVERVINVCDGKNPDLVCWGFDLVTESKAAQSKFFNKYTIINEESSGIELLKKILIEKRFGICTGSAAYNRQWLLMRNLNYTRGCANGEDQEFTFKVLSEAKSVHFICEVLTYIVQRVGSITNSFDIKRFDVVNAMLRTGEYLKQQDYEELNDVSAYITNEIMVINYIRNYLSCINYLTSGTNFSKKESINYLNRELDIMYPGMRTTLRRHMADCKGKSIIFNLEVRLFQTSVIIWCELIGVMKKMKSLLRRN